MHNNQNHSVYCKINCLLWQALYATGRHRDRDIAAACSEVLRILPRDCPCEPGRPGEYEECLERAKHGSKQHKYGVLIRALQLLKNEGRCYGCGSENCSHLWKWQKKCCPDCSCKFTWQDAERIMLAGGECESRLARSGRFSRCRMVGRELQVLQEFGSPVWERHPGTTPWNEYEWRPCSAPAQYTWEQAEAGMRNLREEWEGKLPTWSGFYVFRLNQDDSQYWYFEVKNPNGWTSFHRIDLLEQCTWRPYNPEAKT